MSITGALQNVKFIKAGGTLVLKVSLGNSDVVYELTGADLVIARMTNPSVPFQEAITEYVTAEEAALNDNWALTKEVWFFNADQYVNSHVGWKGSVLTSGSASGVFTPYDGYTNSGTDQGTLQWDFVYSSTSPTVTNGRISINVKNFNPTLANNAVMALFSTGNTYMNRASATTIAPVVHGATGITTSASTNAVAIIQGVLNTTTSQIDTYINQNDLGGTGASPSAPGATPAQLNIGFTGTHRGIQIGDSIGFDPIANYSNQQQFTYRMLVQKHIATVTPVLARFTGLQPNETTAISIFVAQLVELGLWTNIDDIVFLNLQSSANALTGLKGLITGSLVNGATHIPGSGVQTANNSNQYVATGFIPSSMGNVSSSDAIYGGITEFTTTGSTVYWAGASETFFRRKNNGRPRAQLNGETGGDGSKAFTFTKYDYIVQSRAGGAGYDFYENAQLVKSTNKTLGAQDTTQYRIGNNNNNAAMGGISKTAYIGIATGFDRTRFRYAQYYCYNTIALGTALSTNWNVPNATYDWGNQDLAVIHSTELLNIIVSLSTTVTGRTLNLTGNLGLSLKSQSNISILTGQGWNVIT